jgi:hypothetical protein
MEEGKVNWINDTNTAVNISAPIGVYNVIVYTVENSEYSYSVLSYDMNKAREHAKRILLEGYWEKISEDHEQFHAPWRIVKVKISKLY